MKSALFLAGVLLAAATMARVQAAEPTVAAGIDVDTAGNSATRLGQPDACREVSSGDSFDVDVYAAGIPPAAGGAGGLIGFSYNLRFDPAVLEVTAIDDDFLTGAGGEPAPFEVIDADPTAGDNSDALPGTTGNVRVDYLDLSSAAESGSGVLSRVTLRAVGPGRSDLLLVDETKRADAPMIVSSAAESAQGQGVYPVSSVQNAVIAVGEPCRATPSPHVPGEPLVTPPPRTPGAASADSATPGETATGAGQPTATPSGGSSVPTATRTGGATTAPGTPEDDGGGGFPWSTVAIGGVVLAGAAAYVYYRVRKPTE